MMIFKTLPAADAERIAARSLDYQWDVTLGNGFIASGEEKAPRLAEALEALDIRGAADIAIGAIEWCLARVANHLDSSDGLLRLQAAWAATVDTRYAKLPAGRPHDIGPDNEWTLPEWLARRCLGTCVRYLSEGLTAKVRQLALTTLLMAEHVCRNDEAFSRWVGEMLRAKGASSPRRGDDLDYTSRDMSAPTPQQLTLPGRDERLAGLDPGSNPYLCSSAEMAALGFVGDPYPGTP